MCLLNKYYRNCGGYHDSDCIAVLVMVSKAESIVLYLSTCIMYTCHNKDFLPSLTSGFVTNGSPRVNGSEILIRAHGCINLRAHMSPTTTGTSAVRTDGDVYVTVTQFSSWPSNITAPLISAAVICVTTVLVRHLSSNYRVRYHTSQSTYGGLRLFYCCYSDQHFYVNICNGCFTKLHVILCG